MRDDTLGKRIKRLRKAKGLTQAELAGLSGVGVPALSELENDHSNPKHSTLDGIAKALGVTIRDLYPPQ